MEKSTIDRDLGAWVRLPENRAAREAVDRVLTCLCRRGPRRSINPLFLHGPPGSGKSRLVRELVEGFTARAGDALVSVVPAGDLDGRDADDSTSARKQADLVVVEDVQKLPAGAVEPLVALADHCLVRHRQLVLTASVGPGLLELPVRLTSRLGQSLVVALAPLCPASRRAVLRHMSDDRGFGGESPPALLSDEVVDWLSQHLAGSFRQLEGAMQRVLRLQTVFQRSPTLDEVRSAFLEDADSRRLTLERIAQSVGHHYQVKTNTLRSRSRSREVLLPRQVGMYLARQLTEFSLGQIGAYFGGRDHSTVLHACRKVEEALAEDATLSGAVRELRAELR